MISHLALRNQTSNGTQYVKSNNKDFKNEVINVGPIMILDDDKTQANDSN
jgi:hypothetical protein